ncbi:cellulose biosynthesis protein BcsQ [Tamilnaduibacter salinus]|uniref:Cellulose biosynthesis protein BcsQ n=1 Tax=Tamilnaduibacter salinus TaxID=1484056 RepID=A0A2U1CXF3_9GAMM|nr:AAA family ATPase [Tamilnaduibacter salinus]PVY76823.1 cellulose biosynthesis protein BcsQ [Tamilnaduibacter salinus]
MRVIAFHNLKGGVGKTAAAVNTAYLASQAGISTLLWDLDPQGAASWLLSDDEEPDARKLGQLVKGKSPIGSFIRSTPFPKLDLIPAHHSFRNIDIKLDDADNDRMLKQWLKPLSEETSLVVLDCPPSLSRLAEQILRTADGIFVPLIPTWLSLNSWEQLTAFAKDRKIKTNRLHPFFSMVDRRKSLHRDLVANKDLHLPEGMHTTIPNASAIERMGEERLPVEQVSRRSAAAGAYRDLWSEIQGMIWR